MQDPNQTKFFQYKDTQYMQDDDLGMEASTSSIFSEIYLQYLENTKITDILLKYQIIRYFQYVDDVPIVQKNEVTNIQEILDSFNNITPTVTFIMEEVDITISEADHKISLAYIEIPPQLTSSFPMTLATYQYISQQQLDT